MERVRLTAVVQIANLSTNTLKSERVELTMEKSKYERLISSDILEEEIIQHVKDTVFMYDHEFINRVKRYSVA